MPHREHFATSIDGFSEVVTLHANPCGWAPWATARESCGRAHLQGKLTRLNRLNTMLETPGSSLFPQSPRRRNAYSDRKPGSYWICLLAAAIGLSPAAGFAQTVLLDFNSVGEYNNNFNPWNDNGGANGGNYSFAESTTGGVNGSGGVNVFQSVDTTAVYNQGSWDFSTSDAAITISVMVQANGQVSGNKAQLGLLNSDTNGLNNNAGVAFES